MLISSIILFSFSFILLQQKNENKLFEIIDCFVVVAIDIDG